MDYEDFELEIGARVGDAYPVRVLRGPTGEARGSMSFPFDDLELENHLQRVELELLRARTARRRQPQAGERAAEEFGRRLYRALFTGDVRLRWEMALEFARHAGSGLRLKLRVDAPELGNVPWEFLYDEARGEFLSLSTTTPLVRYLNLRHPRRRLSTELPLRILGVVCAPRDLTPLDVEHERQLVEDALESGIQSGLVELEWLDGQGWRDLQRAMARGEWHIVHYVGHGRFDDHRDEGAIAMVGRDGRTRPVTATQLARLLADHPSLRLVVLNACEGALGGQRDIFSSAASILVRRGVPAVVAMQSEISDAGAIEFASMFYSFLGRGFPVDLAMTEARKAISLVSNGPEWGTPVLTMHTDDGQVFDIEEPGQGLGHAPHDIAVPPAAQPAAGDPDHGLPDLADTGTGAGDGDVEKGTRDRPATTHQGGPPDAPADAAALEAPGDDGDVTERPAAAALIPPAEAGEAVPRDDREQDAPDGGAPDAPNADDQDPAHAGDQDATGAGVEVEDPTPSPPDPPDAEEVAHGRDDGPRVPAAFAWTTTPESLTPSADDHSKATGDDDGAPSLDSQDAGGKGTAGPPPRDDGGGSARSTDPTPPSPTPPPWWRNRRGAAAVLAVVLIILAIRSLPRPNDDATEGVGVELPELAIVGPDAALEGPIDQVLGSRFDVTLDFDAGAYSGHLSDWLAGAPGSADIALVPIPEVRRLAAAGSLVSLEQLGMDIAELDARFGSHLLSLGEVDGAHYGVPFDLHLKSLLWFDPEAMRVAGYEPPSTWRDLMALSELVLADGTTPWCIGTGSEGTTGWPATDWIESLVLRMAGPDVYDSWVAGETPFDSAPIRAAFGRFGDLAFAPEYVVGGHEQISQVDFRDAADPLFDDPPGCFLHVQGSFMPEFFPEELQRGSDYDFVTFPTVDGGDGAVVFGSMAVAFTDEPEVADLLDVLSERDAQCELVGLVDVPTGWVSANMQVDAGCHDDWSARMAAHVQSAFAAGTLRHDASDLMPDPVGLGAFWSGMATFTDQGPGSLDAVLTAIDDAWPRE